MKAHAAVLLKALRRHAHAADQPVPQVLLPAKGIHQPLPRRVGHGVDGEITPRKILEHVAHEGHPVGMAVIGIRAVHPEGRDLVGHMPEHHGERAVFEPRFHQMAARKDALHFLRASRGTQIPVLGRNAKETVANAAADHIGRIAVFAQRYHDIQCALWQTLHAARPPSGRYASYYIEARSPPQVVIVRIARWDGHKARFAAKKFSKMR